MLNSLCHCVSLKGYNTPEIGSHSVIDRPESDILVYPPMSIIAQIENVRDINDDVLLQIGQTVEHKKFGIGRIKDIDGTKAVVDFDKHGTKKLISDFLKPC